MQKARHYMSSEHGGGSLAALGSGAWTASSSAADKMSVAAQGGLCRPVVPDALSSDQWIPVSTFVVLLGTKS